MMETRQKRLCTMLLFFPGNENNAKAASNSFCGGHGRGILFFSPFLPAAEITPFYTQNQSPVARIFGLPSIGEPSVVQARKTDLRLIMDLANNFVEDQNQRESIVLDGQSTRISLDARYGISKNLEIGLAIPYIFESGGFTDGLMDSFHNTFGITGGGRDSEPKNRLLYQYQKRPAGSPQSRQLQPWDRRYSTDGRFAAVPKLGQALPGHIPADLAQAAYRRQPKASWKREH
jgi:hypothetical protein